MLVELGDARAVPGLKKARYRGAGGVLGIGESNANACLRERRREGDPDALAVEATATSAGRAFHSFCVNTSKSSDEADRLVGRVDRPVRGELAVAARQRERAAAVGERHLDRLDADARRAPRRRRASCRCRHRSARSSRVVTGMRGSWSADFGFFWPLVVRDGPPRDRRAARRGSRRRRARSLLVVACARSTASRGTAPVPTRPIEHAPALRHGRDRRSRARPTRPAAAAAASARRSSVAEPLAVARQPGDVARRGQLVALAAAARVAAAAAGVTASSPSSFFAAVHRLRQLPRAFGRGASPSVTCPSSSPPAHRNISPCAACVPSARPSTGSPCVTSPTPASAASASAALPPHATPIEITSESAVRRDRRGRARAGARRLLGDVVRAVPAGRARGEEGRAQPRRQGARAQGRHRRARRARAALPGVEHPELRGVQRRPAAAPAAGAIDHRQLEKLAVAPQ